MDVFLKLLHAIGFIFVFFTVGGLTIDGIRQGDYTFPIFLIVVLLISWILLGIPQTPQRIAIRQVKSNERAYHYHSTLEI